MSMEELSDERSTDLRITVCSNGVVNVKRRESDRVHSVFVDESGDVIRCSCKGYHHRGRCSHAEEIAQRPLITSSAVAAQASTQRVATDGGLVDDTADGYERTGKHRGRCVDCGADGPLDTDDNPVVLHEPDCEQAQRESADDAADDEHYAGGTPENTTTDDHGDKVPKRTERADFGGGQSTGVEDL